MRVPESKPGRRVSSDDGRPGAWRPATGEELILNLVVITRDEEFYSRLREIADSCKWRIARAETVDEAEIVVGRRPAPLVVFDGDPGNGNWRFALRRLGALPPHPCVLLASDVADENLLRDVVRNSGYDILPKPASREKLIQALKFAWFWALANRPS